MNGTGVWHDYFVIVVGTIATTIAAGFVWIFNLGTRVAILEVKMSEAEKATATYRNATASAIRALRNEAREAAHELAGLKTSLAGARRPYTEQSLLEERMNERFDEIMREVRQREPVESDQ
jgi:hypothetical protein